MKNENKKIPRSLRRNFFREASIREQNEFLRLERKKWLIEEAKKTTLPKKNKKV